MADTKEISEMIERRLASIELPERARGLYEPVRYALEGGGKRLRPLLAVQACRACGGSADDAVDAALGLEMFHNFTLVHDDIMDNSDTRRGRPSVAARFGNNQAILSGDAMLTLASQLMERVPEGVARAVMSEFNDMALRVYEGQQLDTEFEHRNATIDEYFEMIRLKTGALLASACRIGAMIGGADKATADALYEYGMELGIAFQLRDDWLDTFGDPAVFGKRIGGDIVNRKKTWLFINALNEAPADMAAALSDNPGREELVKAVTDIYLRLNLSERCDLLIQDYYNEAVDAISEAHISEDDRDWFIALAKKLSHRNS